MRHGLLPENAEWLLRMQEMRIRASAWKIDAIHLEGPGDGVTGPTYVVLGYRGPQKIKQLAARTGRDLTIVDDRKAYFLLSAHQLEAGPMHATLRELLAVAGEG